MLWTLQGLLCSNLVSVGKAARWVAAEFGDVTPCSLVDFTEFLEESAAPIMSYDGGRVPPERRHKCAKLFGVALHRGGFLSTAKISVRISNKNNAITNSRIRSTCATHFTCKNTWWYSQTSWTIVYEQCQLAQSLLLWWLMVWTLPSHQEPGLRLGNTYRLTDWHDNVTGLQSKSLSVRHHTLRHPMTTEALKIPLSRTQNAKTSYTENMVSDITQWSPSWKANSSWASREITRILQDPRVHYRVCQGPQLSLSWATRVQSTFCRPVSLRFVLQLPSHLRLGLTSGLFPSCFPTKTSHARTFTLSKLTSSAHSSSWSVPFAPCPPGLPEPS